MTVQESSDAESSTPRWHALDIPTVLSRLQTDPRSGLDHREAAKRLSRHGPNTIREQRHRPLWLMFLDQLTDFMILVLIAAAVASGIVGEAIDTAAILIIVLLNALIGFVQEYRAERAVAALKQMAAPVARVRRATQLETLEASALVPGDIVLLEAGNIVPADLRLSETSALRIDESALTGESQAVEKLTEALPEPHLPLGDRRNLGYKGTLVTRGRGAGVVVATGDATELGRIASLLRSEKNAKTPLQRRLARFGRYLAGAVLLICALIFIAGLLRGEPAVLMFLTAVSLAVAAIPEALPAVVTVSLALGAKKMARHNALIRRLPAVETLGSVTYICADKTGTLTQNRMRAEAFHADGELQDALPGDSAPGSPWNLLARALALNNDTAPDAHATLQGDPTEVALALAARGAGLERQVLERQSPRVGEIPFDEQRKLMTTFHRERDRVIAFTKGAPERVLERCTHMLTRPGTQPLPMDEITAQAEQLAGKGYRVLAFALRQWPDIPDELSPAAVETELTFLGLVALMDPPRPEATEAVELCKSAGITPVMITGDHPATARTIALRLGIAGPSDTVLSGRELNGAERLDTVPVFARVSPEQKIDIVKTLQQRGEFVAMTGDGVNDAPALKRADIGVAMGLKGTDVAREAADIVLLDDNFATIVRAVREGRRIYDNVRKFVKYTMTSNSGEIWTLFLAPFLGLPIPLLPIHILWINLVTDGLPGLALALEPAERDVMERPPRPPGENIFAHGMWQHILWAGLLIGGLSIISQAWAIQAESPRWQTMVFTVLTLSQLVHALVIRSESESLFTLGIGSNRALLGAVLLTLLLQLATIYVPFLNPVFKTEPLTLGELAFCLTLPWTVFVAVEIEKWMVRQGWIYRNSGYQG